MRHRSHIYSRAALSAGLCLLPVLAHSQPEAAETRRVDLDTVVVSASGFEQSINEAPASISVVSRQELEEMRVSSLAEALANIEGVDIGGSLGKTGGLSISMRGMPTDYTLILIDGRRQNVAGNVTPNGFGGTETHFLPPPSAIERIEIIRGPMSTLYGSDAMGGVVNIITRRVNREWAGSLSGGATLQGDSEFGNIYSSDLYASGPLVRNKLGLTLRGSYQNRRASDLAYLDEDGDPIEVSKRGPSPVKSEVYAAGARLDFIPFTNHELSFEADYNWQTYDNREAQLGTLGIQGYHEEQKFNREQFTLAHVWRLDFGQIESSVMRNTTETVGRTIPPGIPDKEAGSDRTLENTNWVVDSKLTASIQNHTVTLGGQYWDAEMIDGVAVAPFEHTQWAVFLEDEWRLQPNLALILGGRYDHHNQFGSQTSPRGYLVWTLSPQWTIKGGVSQGFKVPRLEQITDGITGFVAQGTRPTIGTPSLQPETSTSYELGVAFDNQSWFRAGLTVFRSEFDDKIASGPGVPNATWEVEPNRPGSVDYGYWPTLEEFAQLINIDEAVTKGAEFTTRILFADAWSLTANYTYTESEQKTGPSQGQPLYATPKHMFNSRLRWEATDKLNVWLSGEYRSERYRGTGADYDAFGDYKAYSLFHLGASYQATENLRFAATLYNLLDRNFVDYRPYVSNPTTGAISYTNLYRVNEEPRRLWLSATVLF